MNKTDVNKKANFLAKRAAKKQVEHSDSEEEREQFETVGQE